MVRKKKVDKLKNLAVNKKIHKLCQILMKPSENHNLMRSLEQYCGIFKREQSLLTLLYVTFFCQPIPKKSYNLHFTYDPTTYILHIILQLIFLKSLTSFLNSFTYNFKITDFFP